jgi:hypothetical protein
MAYLNPEARRQLRVDISRFIDEAVSDARSATPPQTPGISTAPDRTPPGRD